jgi:hypothetical protein
MKYLVFVKHSGNIGMLGVERVVQIKKRLHEALDKGSIVGAYAKVGGGLVLIINSPDIAHLTFELRKHHIINAEITPLVALTALLDTWISHHTDRKVAV